mgnify:CR=1 FL=1
MEVEKSNCLLFNNHFNNMIVQKSSGKVQENMKLFYSNQKPTMKIKKFINYLMSFNLIEQENIYITQVYCIGLLKKLFHKGFNININNCHRIILIMLMLTSKIIEDECHCNKSWADVCGLSLKDVNHMESTILKLLEYDLFISREQLMHINKSFIIKL